MPVYDYKCQDHGVFYELATFEQSNLPQACPTCKKMSARIIRIAPEILDMSPVKRKSHERNEKAQHEPEFSTAERRESDHEHSSGCGCSNKIGKSKMFLTANGDKMFPSMRPWMISH